jgi:O-antigen/teichoic acid export membrane protein
VSSVLEIDTPSSERHALVVHGLTWSAIYQVFDVAVSFASMLLLVRLIPPADYGQAAAVGGILAFLNTFNAHVFMTHALQLPEGEEPAWRLHWSAGFYIHALLGLIGQAIAIGCWFVPQYRRIAPLVHLGAIGIFVDWPGELASVFLQRRLNFRRIQILSAVGTLVRLTTIAGFAVAGVGAYGIVLGANVVSGLPFAVDLLCFQRWHPGAGWWKWPDWREYRQALSFGTQRIGGVAIGGVGAVLEAALLPLAIGYQWIGLLTRSRALFGTTAGRVGGVVVDTIYPLLPRVANQPLVFARQARLFVQAMLFVLVPGALFLGVEGPQVSRVLYGHKWVAMDPLIWPGALSGLALTVFGAFSVVLVAAGRVRVTLRVDAWAAVLTSATLFVAWRFGDPVAYGWTLAVTETAVAVGAAICASSLLQPGWISTVLAPPVTAAAIATIAVAIAQRFMPPLFVLQQLMEMFALFAIVFLVALRLMFANSLLPLLVVIPGGRQMRGWLRLSQLAPIQ